MYIQLSRNGQVVVSAMTGHDPHLCNIHQYLPVIYEGDVSVLPRTDKFAPAVGVVAAFESAELHHKLEISGDYKRCVIPHSNLELDGNVSREWPSQ